MFKYWIFQCFFAMFRITSLPPPFKPTSLVWFPGRPACNSGAPIESQDVRSLCRPKRSVPKPNLGRIPKNWGKSRWDPRHHRYKWSGLTGPNKLAENTWGEISLLHRGRVTNSTCNWWWGPTLYLLTKKTWLWPKEVTFQNHCGGWLISSSHKTRSWRMEQMWIKSVPMWFKSFRNEPKKTGNFMEVPQFFLKKVNLQPRTSIQRMLFWKKIWRFFPSSLPAPIPPELPSSASRWSFHASHLCQMLPSHEEPHVGWLGWYVQYHPGVPQRQKSRRLPQRTERQGVTWWGTLRVLTAAGVFTTVLSNETAVSIGKGFDLTFTWGSRSWVH